MGVIPLETTRDPSRLSPPECPLLDALDAVAVRAAVTRRARLQDWGPHAARVERWCWAALGDAIDELANAAPARYGEEATRRHEALLQELRADLGLPPGGAA